MPHAKASSAMASSSSRPLKVSDHTRRSTMDWKDSPASSQRRCLACSRAQVAQLPGQTIQLTGLGGRRPNSPPPEQVLHMQITWQGCRGAGCAVRVSVLQVFTAPPNNTSVHTPTSHHPVWPSA
jgi:hypothetical protein